MKLTYNSYALTIFTVLNSIFASAQIQHVEPVNWWTGMKNPNLQLLVNGVDIGETTPSISYPGITIKKTTKGDSRNYLFIDLVISKTAKPGIMIIDFKKANKVVYAYKYPLLERQQDALQ